MARSLHVSKVSKGYHFFFSFVSSYLLFFASSNFFSFYCGLEGSTASSFLVIQVDQVHFRLPSQNSGRYGKCLFWHSSIRMFLCVFDAPVSISNSSDCLNFSTCLCAKPEAKSKETVMWLHPKINCISAPPFTCRFFMSVFFGTGSRCRKVNGCISPLCKNVKLTFQRAGLN